MFKGMEYVYEVYKEKSFSKAAHNLYISQPALSATIKKIENKVGAPLFDRSTNPIQLTECGREYVKCMLKIMDLEAEFENYLSDMDELKTGNISIGGTNLYSSFVLPPIITSFTQKYPGVQINLVEADTSLLEQKLAGGMLDLVIDNYAFSSELYSCYPFATEHLILAVPQKSAANEQAKDYRLTWEEICQGKHLQEDTPCVPLQLFAEEPFLFLRSGNDTRLRADHICHQQNFSPRIILKLDQQATAFHLACYGMGCTFVSDTLVHHVRQSHEIYYYKLDPELSARNVNFYHKKGRYLTRALKEFLNINCSFSE